MFSGWEFRQEMQVPTAGAVRIVDTCSVTLGEFARTGPNFARYVQAGRVRSLDNT